MPTGDTRARTLADSIEVVGLDLPCGTLGGPVRDAIDRTASAIGPELVRATGEIVTPSPTLPEAMASIALLEASERAEGHVHSLANSADERPGESTLWAVAAGWLRSRAAELAAGLGPEYLECSSVALAEIAEGWMREARDLYDAGRTVDRYMAAVNGTRGALGALAASLGGRQAGLDPKVVPDLADAARGLATAARIRDDLRALTPADDPERPPGQSLARGVYALPTILSIERDPGLARSLGGAIASADLAKLVERIWAAGGPLEAGERCHRLIEKALSATTAIEGADTLTAVGERIVAGCDSAVTP